MIKRHPILKIGRCVLSDDGQCWRIEGWSFQCTDVDGTVAPNESNNFSWRFGGYTCEELAFIWEHRN